MSQRPPTFYAWLSLATSLVTIVLKFAAYFLTGSVGLLSDAVEAVVNIVAALVALGVLLLAANAGLFRLIDWHVIWPALFIGLGVILLARQSGWGR